MRVMEVIQHEIAKTENLPWDSLKNENWMLQKSNNPVYGENKHIHPMVCLHEMPVYVDVLCMMWKLFTGTWTNRRFSPFIFYIFYIISKIYIFTFYNCFFFLVLVALGLCCFTGLSLVAVSRGYSLVTVAFLVVTHGLQRGGLSSCVHGLSCPVACGISPEKGSNLCPLHW